MADLGDAFLSSLQTGLNIARSYRDEARLNEEIERKNRRDALLDRLALNQDARAAAAEGRLAETYNWEKTNVRPTQLKLNSLNVENAEIGVKKGRVELQYLPMEKEAGLARDRAATQASLSSAGYTRAQTRKVGLETQILQQSLAEQIRSRETATVLSQLSDPSFDARKIPTGMVPQLLAVTGLTQSAQTARNVLGQVARGDWSWAQNANTVRQVQFFLRPEARRSAAAQGFNPKTADITSFSLNKNGLVVNYAARGLDGNFVRWSDTLPADKLAAKMDIAGGAADRLRSNPNLRANILSLYQRSDPQGYRQVVAAAGESIDSKIKDLKEAAKGNGPEATQARKDLATIVANREAAINSQVLNYLGVVGQKLDDFGDSAGTAVAFARRNVDPNLPDDKALNAANKAVAEVKGWLSTNKVDRLRNAGILPKTYRNPTNTFQYLQLYEIVMRNPRAEAIVMPRTR